MHRDDFASTKPVTRDQWRRIAVEALDWLQEPPPANRLEATELLARFAAAIDERDGRGSADGVVVGLTGREHAPGF